jgi:hypothetical protein
MWNIVSLLLRQNEIRPTIKLNKYNREFGQSSQMRRQMAVQRRTASQQNKCPEEI